MLPGCTLTKPTPECAKRMLPKIRAGLILLALYPEEHAPLNLQVLLNERPIIGEGVGIVDQVIM